MIKDSKELLVKDQCLESLFFHQLCLDCKIFLDYQKMKGFNHSKLTFRINQIILFFLHKFCKKNQAQTYKKKQYFFHRFFSHLVQIHCYYKVNKMEKKKKLLSTVINFKIRILLEIQNHKVVLSLHLFNFLSKFLIQ